MLHKKLRELEEVVQSKDIIIQSKEKELSKAIHKHKKLKKENKDLKKDVNILKNQFESSNKVTEQLQAENGQFKDNQLDFQSILNDKIEQITKELKMEREKRLAEQNYSRVYNINIINYTIYRII